MSKHYESQWEIVSEFEFELLDGNKVLFEWRAANHRKIELTMPDEIQISTTCDSDGLEFALFHTIISGRDYVHGWEPIIFSSVEDATADLESSPFQTTSEFLAQFRKCVIDLWNAPFDFVQEPVGLFSYPYHKQLYDEAVANLSENEFADYSDAQLDELLKEWQSTDDAGY